MGDGMTGYFKKAHPLPRTAYISRNKILTALEGMEYFFAEYGEGIRRPVTRQMEEGQKLHAMILEPEEFRRRKCVSRFKDPYSPEAKAWALQRTREVPEAVIMTLEESLRYDRIIDRIMSHKLAGPLISKALKERHGYAQCPRTGALLYSRPDIVTAEGWIAELKFVKSVDKFEFNRQQHREKWFMQLAFYNAVDGLISGTRKTDNCFYIAVEHFYPHRMRVLPMSPKFEEMGERLWNFGADKVVNALKADPEMKNFEVWRQESNVAETLEPELWMLTNDPLYSDIIGN